MNLRKVFRKILILKTVSNIMLIFDFVQLFKIFREILVFLDCFAGFTRYFSWNLAKNRFRKP